MTGDLVTPLKTADIEPELLGILDSAAHFYEAEDQMLGVTENGVHRVLLNPGTGDIVGKNVNIGEGNTPEEAVVDTLARMRSLETIRTPSMAQIEMRPGVSVTFTELEKYRPRIAPIGEAYPIPSYIEKIKTVNHESSLLLQETIKIEGWEAQTVQIVADFLDSSEFGTKLARDLNIKSLGHLTPEQAVKLSTAFVQSVSKYTYSDIGKTPPTRADQSSTMDLLREGIAKKGDPEWEGNGVCRNIAANVKIVFEALKASQVGNSMLSNTYCEFTKGLQGMGYRDAREDSGNTTVTDSEGHAWNTFYTVDAKGAAAVTIVDATWALEANPEKAIEHLDRTKSRAMNQMARLFDASEIKGEALASVVDFVNRVVRAEPPRTTNGITSYGREPVYAVTKMLDCIGKLGDKIPEGVRLEGATISVIKGIAGQLDPYELESIFAIEKKSGMFNEYTLDKIINDYLFKRPHQLARQRRARNHIFEDDELQEKIYQTAGPETVSELAESDGQFRARYREMHPEQLPSFDPDLNAADLIELRHFASQHNIFETDPKQIKNAFKRRLSTAMDEQTFTEITSTYTEYQIFKNFRQLIHLGLSKRKEF